MRTESPSTQQIETPGRPGTPAGLRVQRLRRIEEVHALQGEWRELAEHADPPVSVFSSWDWVVSWYEHFAGREDVCLLTVRARDDRLVGVAPCSFRRLGRLRPRWKHLAAPVAVAMVMGLGLPFAVDLAIQTAQAPRHSPRVSEV